MRRLLNLVPDIPGLNELIVYVTSVIYHRSFLFYFGRSLNGHLLRSKTRSHALSRYVDKIAAKEHIRRTCGDAAVIQTLGVWDSRRLIPHHDQWVFKSNDDFRGALIYDHGVITDVKKACFSAPVRCANQADVIAVLDRFVRLKPASAFRLTREACYLGIDQAFFFEEVVSGSTDRVTPVDEYKFHIIQDEIAFVYVVLDRLGTNRRAIIDPNGRPLDITWCKPRDRYKFDHTTAPVLSASFDEMRSYALRSARGFPYVRVDVYDAPSPKVGELTFFHGSGLEPIQPRAFDYELGRRLSAHDF